MGVIDHAIVRPAAPSALRVSDRDTVAVALRELVAGETVEVGGQSVTLAETIPAKHKFALRPHTAGEPVVRFGQPIGRATQPIAVGAHVHVHNVETALGGPLDYKPSAVGGAAKPLAASTAHFEGYRRADGLVGVRNDIWIIPTVGCVANACEQIARRARERFAGRVDAVVALTHPLGCSQLGEDLAGVRDILAALARHPNVGGVLLVGLGCESNQADALLARASGLDPTRTRVLLAQDCGDEIEDGLALAAELVAIAEQDQREPCALSDLVIGLKCGGSDALSGLTANPLLGDMTDRVTASGGGAILTEIPEIFGAEHLLMQRAVSEEVFAAIAALVNDFKAYFLDAGQPVHENPSPGNKAGGITTLEEKSLGAVQKAGQAAVTDVLRYGERVRRPGLTLLEAPGNDAVSSTALAAAGATIILFTTGRGTPLGFPVPTIKIASNSELAGRKPSWIDFDAGAVLATPTREPVADALLELIVKVASGQRTCNERNGEQSIALWKRGVTL